ncbi:lipopolysaccharide biosynthesis protein [Aliivibrio fischeri]|uniref:lipopolysaccharide biosynthesis protein n=1 Tax=Aliivibrio fischeri TaxID=668 RepID=UPI001F369588|nr:lipopolysaccharide biosynthesis protein [Aliivibrio fischeri]MCE4935499.1 lipopolysaccharide biosynthesis protein [Aliivibrio fischeri]
MPSLRQKTTDSLKWSAIERLVTQMVQFAVMLFLARLLGPDAFGLIGMLTVFIAISQVFVDSGMTSALIRKLDRTEQDFSTAFYFNIIVALLCYLLLYLLAPSIAHFYGQLELTSLTRVLAIVVIVNGFCVIQRAKLTIRMDFKTQAKASLLSVAISSIVALTLAYMEFGVWTLVGQSISSVICNALFLNVLHPWRPKGKFSRHSFLELFGFGSKLLISRLIDSFYQNIYQLIIGKQFNSIDVGFFTQANQLVKTPTTTLTAIIQRVTYPMLSSIQDQSERLNATYLLTLRLSALVIFPLIIGLAVTADLLIPVILGKLWQPAAILVLILSFGLVLYPIHAINLNYLQVKGRSDLFLKLEVIKKLITTVILFFSVPNGVIAICLGMAIQSHFALVINTYYTGKLGNLGFVRQIRCLAPIWVLSVVCCFSSRLLSLSVISYEWGALAMTIILSIILYIIGIRLFQEDLYHKVAPKILKKFLF